MHASLRKELGARYSLLNLSIHDLVEEFARHSVYAVFKCLASSSNLSITIRCANSSGLSRSSSCNYPLYNNSATIVFVRSNANVVNTGREVKTLILGSSALNKYSKKHLKVREADALKQVDANRLELEAQLRKASKEEELAKTKKEKREKENKRQSLCKSRDGNRTLHSRRLIGAYILYFKELLSNNGRIFASVIGITRTRAIVLSAIIEHVYFKN
ncbi:hypothetical protein HBH97_171170 [Parastagonospora nodorum]|nr:hypothetical protein HBH97_171170 [Parastagonospora nodorum]